MMGERGQAPCRHCERSEAIQGRRAPNLRSGLLRCLAAPRNDGVGAMSHPFPDVLNRRRPTFGGFMRIGTPLSPSAFRVTLLGSGELGKEVAIELQRFGV